jgi:protoheme IX farnesyltransferase
MWTPPHFWALALFMRNDYDDAEVPMLTVTHGRRATRNHILGYTVLLAVLAIATGFTSIGGVFYLDRGDCVECAVPMGCDQNLAP